MLLLKHRKSIILFVALFLAGCFLFSMTADASLVPCGKTSGTEAEMQPCTLCHLVVGFDRIIEWGFKILTFVAIAALVAAGIIYIVSAGNEKLMETAKNFAKYTLMGFAIVLGAWLIVNYTMILLSKKADLGIGITSWSEFECDTESDLGKKSDPDCISLGGVCSTEHGSPKCCEGTCRPLTVVGGVPSTFTCQDCLGVGSPCDENSECCSGYCDFTGVVFPQKGVCNNSSDAKCYNLDPPGSCEKGACPDPLVPYEGFTDTCDGGEICCKYVPKGDESDYTYQAGIAEQLVDRSAALTSLMECMKNKLPQEAKVISSISDSAGIHHCIDDYDYLCAHSQYSCHYGGKECRDEYKSYAVDFANEDYYDEINTAAKSCVPGAFVNYESNHIHVSVGAVNGCGCN